MAQERQDDLVVIAARSLVQDLLASDAVDEAPALPANEAYLALVDVERRLRNALTELHEAQRVPAAPSAVRADTARVAADLADILALAAASRDRALEVSRAERAPDADAAPDLRLSADSWTAPQRFVVPGL